MSMKLKYLLVLVLMMACEEPVQWDLKSSEQEVIVVEGLLSNEYKRHSIKISRPFAALNDTPEPVSGAKVSVRTGTSEFDFTEFPQGSGMYWSDTLQAVVNRQYQLVIQFMEKEYTAFAEMFPVDPLEPLNYRLVNSEKGLYEINFEESDQPSAQEYLLVWSHVSGYEDLPTGETVAHTYHYSLSTIDVNEAFKPEKAKILFPAGAVVLRKKYSLSPDHQAFLRTFLSETEWRGSVFDVQKGNVATNLSEGAIGFFAVSTVVSDTTVIIP